MTSTARTRGPAKSRREVGSDHPLCRPPKGSHDVRALRNGRWRDDDGETPTFVFFGLEQPDDGSPMQSATVWVAKCSCALWADCPASKALAKASDIYGAASIVIVKACK